MYKQSKKSSNDILLKNVSFRFFFIFNHIHVHDSCVVIVTQKSGLIRPVFLLYIYSVVPVKTSHNIFVNLNLKTYPSRLNFDVSKEGGCPAGTLLINTSTLLAEE